MKCTLKELRDIITNILDEKFAPFNPRALQGMSVEELLNYVKKYEFYAQGSARRVYLISSSKILKVARNEKGLGQNEAELEIYNSVDEVGKYVLPKIYDHDKSGDQPRWMLSEMVRPLEKRGEFEAITGISGDVLREIVENLAYYGQDTLSEMENDPDSEYYELYQENKQFIDGLGELIITHNLLPGDIVPRHFGITAADRRVVLYDYGYTSFVREEYY